MENNYSEITLLSNNVYVVNDRNINWGGEVNHNFEILNNLNKNASLKIKYNGQEVNYRITGDNLEVDLNDLTPANGIFTLNVNGKYLTAFSANQKTDLSADIRVPTKTSDLDNDAEFITLNDIPSVNVPSKVSQLQNDSGYLTSADLNVPTKVSQLQNDSGYLTSADVNIPTVPTNVSEFTNDAGYLTNADLKVPTKTSDLQNDSGFVTLNDLDIPSNTSDLTNDSGFITLNDVPSVNVPTKVSQLQNDAGYLTSADLPQADIPTKTSDLTNDSGFITSDDLPDITVPTKTSDLNNDSGFVTLNDLEIPTKTSDLTNDSGFITSSDVPTKTSDLSNDSGFITINDVPVVTVPERTSDLTNDSGFITSEDLQNITAPTKTSDLTNDSGFITSSDVPVTNGVLTLEKDGETLGTFTASESTTINLQSSSFNPFETESFTVLNAIKIAIPEAAISEFGYSLQGFVPRNFFSKIQYKYDKGPFIRGAYYKETQVIDDVTYYVGLIPVSAGFLQEENASLDVFIPKNKIPTYFSTFLSTTSADGYNFFKLDTDNFTFEGERIENEDHLFTRILPNTNVSEVI